MSIELLDPDEKKRRGYVELKSKVYRDGREWLVGKDWDQRRWELLRRCGGRCENIIQQFPIIIPCFRDAEDPHHVVLRSELRDDRMSNLLAVCAGCHRKLDREQRAAKRQARRERMSA